ncbi:hypothetical protein [Chitinophaga sp. CF418]|uniref:hypothetical protein n=1 Tax=Chitinophaga sp. CF418 TaxID=1855287 RepID=UPI000910FF98|nr:hypothetical protein [Chitinophaga sp. CF418]SHM36956.1 hypothetical protein SAMN05216311_10224 [Chitinophaga sp. CF418]
MLPRYKIALRIPNDRGKYFSFRLHEHLANEPTDYIQPKKLVVIAGINGNFQTFCNLLIKSEVLDTSLGWIFQDNHLVILGDYTAHNAHPVESLWFIYSLENKARKAGGYVHLILGDHELTCLNGDWCYDHPRYAKLHDRSYERAVLFDGNGEIKRWLLTKNIVEKIGNSLFTHVELTHHVVQAGLSLSQINSLARHKYSSMGKITDLPFITMWSDKEKVQCTSEKSNNGISEELLTDNLLAHFNVHTIVTGGGNTRRVNSRYNDKIVDVCADHVDNRSEALFVKYDRFYRFTLEGRLVRIKQTGVWNGKQVIRQE